MCLSAEKPFFEATVIVALHELTLFILDEIEEQAACSSVLCAQVHNGALSYKKPVVLNHDRCEDG